MTNYGKRIKDIRTQRGMSAESLAERIGVSPATIYRYENGTINSMTTDKLLPIADALGVSPSDIMGWGVSQSSSFSVKDVLAEQGIASRVVDTKETLSHKSPVQKTALDNVIDQLMAMRDTTALNLAPDEKKLLDLFRHMTTSKRKRALVILEQLCDF